MRYLRRLAQRIEVRQVFAEFLLQVLARKAKGHRRLQEARLEPQAETLAAEAQAIDAAAFGDLVGDGVGQLDFRPSPA